MTAGREVGAAAHLAGGVGSWAPPGYLAPRRHGTIRDVIEAGTHFRVEGAGPAVVLVHGVGLDMEMWAAQAPALAERYTVVRYDMLWHGASAKPPGAGSLRSLVDQLDMLHGYFQLQRMVLVGFSMGALVAQAYALRRPDTLAGLVLLSAVHDRAPVQRAAVRERLALAEREGPGALVEAALARWFSPAFARAHPEVVAAVRRRLETNDRQGFLAAYRLFAEADAALAGRLDAIACPTLIATGALDPGSTPTMAEAMAAAIPKARLALLPGLRHLAPIEGAVAVNRLLSDFLDEVGRAETTR